ncbi:hypothetical protein BGW38_007869 [Lunasporangiospora selenospora]|uniref:Hydrolase of the HAD superfamily n=1 Tax=Lunasporangiospora selenospora TaxID=979761 RepID=A0A9P6FY39_9FUNG|nr:hypothetical protein BGW38_007869 [Lunasporangiospora selenospora]
MEAPIITETAAPATYGESSLDRTITPNHEIAANSIDRSITPNHEPRVFFFDVDNCLYPKDSGIPDLMRAKIEKYFEDVGFDSSEGKQPQQRFQPLPLQSKLFLIDTTSTMALRSEGFICIILIDIRDYDEKVDLALPLEDILHENIPLREMIKSLKVEKKWLFTNAGKEHALRVVKILGLEGLFDGMTYCNYIEPNFVCKPEKAAFEKAMREAGVVHGSNCYFVDDSAANVDKAVDLGWTAVHVADDPVISNFGHFQIADIIELKNVLPHLWDDESNSNLAGKSSASSSSTTLATTDSLSPTSAAKSGQFLDANESQTDINIESPTPIRPLSSSSVPSQTS